jgi:hypothetical protein
VAVSQLTQTMGGLGYKYRGRPPRRLSNGYYAFVEGVYSEAWIACYGTLLIPPLYDRKSSLPTSRVWWWRLGSPRRLGRLRRLQGPLLGRLRRLRRRWLGHLAARVDNKKLGRLREAVPLLLPPGGFMTLCTGSSRELLEFACARHKGGIFRPRHEIK